MKEETSFIETSLIWIKENWAWFASAGAGVGGTLGAKKIIDKNQDKAIASLKVQVYKNKEDINQLKSDMRINDTQDQNLRANFVSFQERYSEDMKELKDGQKDIHNHILDIVKSMR